MNPSFSTILWCQAKFERKIVQVTSEFLNVCFTESDFHCNLILNSKSESYYPITLNNDLQIVLDITQHDLFSLYIAWLQMYNEDPLRGGTSNTPCCGSRRCCVVPLYFVYHSWPL